MKKLRLFFLFISFGIISFGQDLIIRTDGVEIQAKVLEIGTNEIKYRSFENPEGPVYVVLKRQVLMIKYENGTKDVFNTGTTSTPAPKTVAPPPEPKSPFYKNRQHRYFSVALGYGNSYGGLGVRMQSRAGGEVGFGFHWGTGYLPAFDFMGLGVEDGTFMASAGLKLFVYKGIYLNTQFGIFGKEYDLYYDGTYDYYYDYDEDGNYYELLFGPSFMAGVDWVFGKHFGFNAAGGISLPVTGFYAWDKYPAVDLGFVIKF